MEVVKVKVKDLPKTSQTPMLTYARKLIKEGCQEDTVVEFYREREEPDMVFHHLGRCAKLTVKEEPRLHFAKYREPVFNKHTEKAMTSPSGIDLN